MIDELADLGRTLALALVLFTGLALLVLGALWALGGPADDGEE